MKKISILIVTLLITAFTFSLSVQAAAKKDLSNYKGVKMGKVMDAFPKGGYEYKYGLSYYRYNGLQFFGNGEGVKPRNVKITHISIQDNTKYNLYGVKVGMSKSKAISKLKDKGWKSYTKNGDTIAYKARNGWRLSLLLKNGKVWIVSIYKN